MPFSAVARKQPGLSQQLVLALHKMNELLVIFGLALLNGFFSAAEISMLSVRRTRLMELASNGKRSAIIALQLRKQPENFLATVQVGITVIGATAGAFGGATLERPLAQWLTHVGITRGTEQIALALVVAFVSVLSIVLGELVPKSLALRSSERISLAVARPIALMSSLAKPAVWVLTQLSNLILRPFRDTTTFSESRLSPEELRSLVEEAASSGAVPRGVGDIASRAIDLGQLAVSALMIPRKEVSALRIDADYETVWNALQNSPHARYPVVRDNLDAVEGYVLARDLVPQLVDKRVDVRAVLREVPAFVEPFPAIRALRELQRRRSQLAVIVDEHGMTSGVVTIEDIVEELVGEILEEHERPVDLIQSEAEGVALVRAETSVQEVNRRLGIDLPISPDYATLSGLLMHSSARIMRPGERILIHGATIEVIDAGPRRVKLVRIWANAEAASASSDATRK